jgi:DNA-binding GntR family transcriptional regulator
MKALNVQPTTDHFPNNDLAAERTTLHDEVAGKLREIIYNGELAADSRVDEKHLCERLGISRTPLREAIKVLAREGWVYLVPNRGARVARLKPEDIDEIFPIMGALESVAGEAACRYITKEGITEIRALHYQMALHHTRGERSEYFNLNQQIHENILEAANNPSLIQVYKSLTARIRRARYTTSISQDQWDEAMAEHEKILKALEERNGPELGELLKVHLLNKSEAVKSVIREMK